MAAPAFARAELAQGLDQGASALGLALAPEPREQLLDYLALLARWNRVYNLTAVRDPRDMLIRHLLDSLAVLPWLEGGRLLDVGTGAGLPGVVLAIVRPALQVDLLDASAKRTRFCRQAVAELELPGVTVLQTRVEAHRDAAGYGCIVSRAFASLPELLAGVRHLLAPGGVLLAMKGRDPRSEVDGLPREAEARIESVEVPGLDAPRHIVAVRV